MQSASEENYFFIRHPLKIGMNRTLCNDDDRSPLTISIRYTLIFSSKEVLFLAKNLNLDLFLSVTKCHDFFFTPTYYQLPDSKQFICLATISEELISWSSEIGRKPAETSLGTVHIITSLRIFPFIFSNVAVDIVRARNNAIRFIFFEADVRMFEIRITV